MKNANADLKRVDSMFFQRIKALLVNKFKNADVLIFYLY